MSKRIITAACFAVLAAGCGTTQGGTTTSGSTGTTSHPTSSGSTAGSTTSQTNTTGSGGTTSQTNTTGSGGTTSQTTAGGSSGGGSTTGAVCVPETDIATFRANVASGQIPSTTSHTLICLNGVVAVGSLLAGSPADAGAGFPLGTRFDGNYFFADQSANVIHLKKFADSPMTGDPARGASADANAKIYTFDGGTNATEFELLVTSGTSQGQGITTPSASGALSVPTPKTATFADLDHTNFQSPVIGSYVKVPAGSYTANFNDPGLIHTQAGTCASGCVDGFSLTDGTSTVWVDTFDWFTKTGSGHDKSCWPTDGGALDLSGGNFNAVFDIGRAPDGSEAALLYLVDCSDLP